MTSSAETSPIRVAIGLFLLTVLTFLGYWLVLDQRIHTQSIAYNQRGNTLSEQGRYDEAINNYQQAITLHPGFVQAYNNMGSALAGQGRFEEAIVHFEQAINFDSNYRAAQKNLELARSLVGKSNARVQQEIR